MRGGRYRFLPQCVCACVRERNSQRDRCKFRFYTNQMQSNPVMCLYSLVPEFKSSYPYIYMQAWGFKKHVTLGIGTSWMHVSEDMLNDLNDFSVVWLRLNMIISVWAHSSVTHCLSRWCRCRWRSRCSAFSWSLSARRIGNVSSQRAMWNPQ